MTKTAEAVSPKHPDKMCDQISDAILDWCLTRDPNARVAIEVMGGHGQIKIMGELTMKFSERVNADDPDPMTDFEVAATKIAKRIAGNLTVELNVKRQSPEIAQGVDTGGAGDQGIMIGYACDDNEAMIPQELFLARSLCRFIYDQHSYDGKTQITIDDEGNIQAVVASFQKIAKEELVKMVDTWLIDQKRDENIVVHVNPAGDWDMGGFDADTGLTGRKLMVDNYGPQVAIGGGAFSGKDATKVDRSAAYKARELAVWYLSALKENGVKEVTVKLAYAIGVAEPVMAIVHTKTKEGKEGTIDLTKAEVFASLTPNRIIQDLKLREPQYEKTAQWGHFGNGFLWDQSTWGK